MSIENKKDNIIEYMDETTAGAIRNDIGVMGDSTIEGRSLVDKTNLLKTQVDTNVQNITDNSNKINNLSAEVDEHKADTATHMTPTEKSKLAGIAAGAQVNTVTSVNGKTGAVSLAPSDVGAATAAQGAKADNALPKAGGTLTGNVVANTGTDYTTKRVRNIRFKTGADFTTSELAAGDIGFIY